MYRLASEASKRARRFHDVGGIFHVQRRGHHVDWIRSRKATHRIFFLLTRLETSGLFGNHDPPAGRKGELTAGSVGIATLSTAKDERAHDHAGKRVSECRCLAILPMVESI